MIRRMTEPSWTDQLSAYSMLATAVISAVIAFAAFRAWHTAKAALEASREASEAARASAEAARAANEQARLDSQERTRPYVWVEVVPGLSGPEAYDVRIANTGKSAARQLRFQYDSWPEPLDDVATKVRELFDTPRTLPPACSIRSFWRLEGPFDDGTSEAGMGKHGTIRVSYTSDDPAHPEYQDSFDVILDKSGLWPVGEHGPNPVGIKGGVRSFYLLGQALVRTVAELKR